MGTGIMKKLKANALFSLLLPFCGVGFTFALAKAAVPTPPGGPVKQGLQLCAVVPQSYYRVEEPIILDVQLRNKRTKDLFFEEPSPSISKMMISIKDASGHVVPWTAYGRKLYHDVAHPSPLHYHDLGVFAAAGDQVVYHVWLNRAFDLTIPGTYTVTVQKRLASLSMWS